MVNGKIDGLINHARSLIDQMQDHYCEFGNQIAPSEVHNTYFSDIDEFLNLRMETISSAKTLTDEYRVADALALCRALLESLLLFKLITNGTKYSRTQILDPGEDLKVRRKKLVRSQKARIGKQDVQFIDVFADEMRKNCINYVFEGLKDKGDDGLIIPIYYFYFQEYDPRSHRLDLSKYHQPFPFDSELIQALKANQRQAQVVSRNYLNYSAMKKSLKLNGMLNSRGVNRLEAHYTFLGSFVHSTHGAARELHINSNVHSGRTRIGLEQKYDQSAQLLVYAYLLHLLNEYLSEYIKCYNNAPSKYIAGFHSTSLEQDMDLVKRDFGFFWFLDESAPAYDKYDYAISHGKALDITDFNDIPSEVVLFDSHIYARFCNALTGWTNSYWGSYYPPGIQ